MPNINTTPDRLIPIWNIKNITKKNYKYIWIFKFVVAVERGIEIWSISGDKEKGRRRIFYQIILYPVNYNFSLIIKWKYCCLKFLHHLKVLRWKLERDSAWFYSILYSGSENRRLQESKALLYFSWELLDISINLQILVVDALWGSKNCCIQWPWMETQAIIPPGQCQSRTFRFPPTCLWQSSRRSPKQPDGYKSMFFI